jgi:hypothetical protein
MIPTLVLKALCLALIFTTGTQAVPWPWSHNPTPGEPCDGDTVQARCYDHHHFLMCIPSRQDHRKYIYSDPQPCEPIPVCRDDQYDDIKTVVCVYE